MQLTKQRFHGGVFNQLAALNDANMATEHFRFFEIVSGENDRHTLRVDLLEKLPHGTAQFDINASGWLIKNQQLRLMH
ncbi:Uncharacterised protein [Vibrio cholerae]|nr:Uncharacterised protein [Vibrio cholerae]